MDERAISFGSFRLLPSQRLLLEGDQPVRLGSRALDILAALAENAGRLVPKEELIARVWPQVFVEESNLKIQVSALRRALGDGQGGNRYIVTVPGRGYEFVVPVSRTAEPAAMPAPAVSQPGTHNLPFAVTRMIGREETVASLISRLARERLVTIVGPGGIGKTTLALAAAEAMLSAYEDGVWFIDLAPLTDPRLVPRALATVLGFHAEDPLPGLVASLPGKRMLVVLDNCEHVIEAAAGLAAILLRGAPGISVLATSREPLQVAGEREYRLRPLATPSPSPVLTAAHAQSFPAVQLFLERVSTVIDDFALSDADAPLVVEICRRLDGVPLAIELAAARIEVLGVRGLAAHLDDSLQLLRARHRRALPRHQTIRAVLDWSYVLLSEDEKLLFRRIGVFASAFDLKAAAGIASDADLAPEDVVERLSGLVAKSLVTVYLDTPIPRFRLGETTRAYALEKLAESGERERLLRCGAEYGRDRLERAQATLEARPTADLLLGYGYWADNIRLALDWAFSSEGDASVGVALTAAAVPLWMHLSLVEECRERCDGALRALQTDHMLDARLRMRLQIGLGNSLLHTRAPSEQAQTVLTEALQSAEALGDLHAQLRVLLDLASVLGFRGQYAKAAAASERARAIAQQIGDTTGVVFADRRMGMILLRLGRLTEAQRCFERVISAAFYRQEGVVPSGQHSDERAMARAMLARALWLRGFSERALREAQASLDEVQGSDRQLTMCRVLLYGMGRITPMTGDFAAAETAVSSILKAAESAAAPFWSMAGQFLRGKLLVERHQFAEGLAVLREAFEICDQTGWRLSYPEFMGSFALALAGLGRLDEAHDAVGKAIEAAGGGEDGQQWYLPELLRIKGDVLLQQKTVTAAEECFREALGLARKQEALFWELRVAISFARVRVAQRRAKEARQLLAPVYDCFTEGFEMPALRAAKALLDELPP